MPALADKAYDGLIVTNRYHSQVGAFTWFRAIGEDFHLTSKTNAKLFSDALSKAGLLKEPAGSKAVKELFDATFPKLANKKWPTKRWDTWARVRVAQKLVEDFKAKAAALALQSPKHTETELERYLQVRHWSVR